MANETTVKSGKTKNIIIIVLLIIVAGAALDSYNKYGGIFASSPTDSKLQSYCKEFIEKYYPQNSGIKFGTVFQAENETRKVQAFIKSENIITVTEEVQFEFDKYGKLIEIYQMQDVAPFCEQIKLVPYSILTFNSEHNN